MERPKARSTAVDERAALLLAVAARSRWASRECGRGAAAAALVSIASVAANAAGGVAAALILVSALLARRIMWLVRARSEQADAVAAEMAASFAASNWRQRTRPRPSLRVVL